MSVKIVRLRHECAEDNIPPTHPVFNLNGSPSTHNAKVAHRLPIQMDGRHKIHRFNEDVERTHVPVLLPSGQVVAIPEQVFRGRVAFKFGRRKNKLLLVCAWCGKSLGEAESEIEGVSHGMCQECFDKITATGVLNKNKATAAAH